MSSKSRNSSANEHERLKALRQYDILDTPSEEEFDNITRLAALICNAPIAVITLVDESRLFFKSFVGLPDFDIPKKGSFSEETIKNNEVLEVQDALNDQRFKDHPLVSGKPNVRFYAGAPLVDGNGFKLGVIAVFDVISRHLTNDQKKGLETLAGEIITHITLKKKNTQLDANTQRFEELLNLSTVSPEIHCILDYSGNILFINNAVTGILGYTAAEATGLSMWDFCYRDDIDHLVSVVEDGLKKKAKQFNIEFRITSKTGVVRWLSWNMVAKDGRWYTYGRDITENKRVENELQVLSLVASKTNTGVNISDDEGNTTWVNQSLEQLTGYTLEELKGKKLGDVLSKDATHRDLIQAARVKARNNESYTIEVQAKTKHDKPVWLSVSNTPVINEKGKVERQIDLITDITLRKQIERGLVESKEQALQLSEAKEMFLSVMSHEIRTPLNAVIGMTHLLIDNDPRPSQVDDLNILKFSAENLLNIINDILDFTKIETGNLKLEFIPFSIKALAGDIINSLQINASQKGNKLRLLFDNRIPADILGDKTRLYQILMNLLGNAIKFTDYGKIGLKIKLSSEDESTVTVGFEISDTGIGIPKDKQSYIFETFTQAKTDISRKYGGTGLGLAITKKLLKLHQSDIKVKSKEGKGTLFYFTIRYDKVLPDNKMVQPVVPPASFAGKKILVVDDNEINILIANRILSKLGLSLEFARNGKEAIEKIMDKTFDLIFMDIQMPGIDGFETTGIIRELPDEYFKSVPIIALTASTLQDENSKFKVSGMNGHILKPFKPDEIKKILLLNLPG